MLVIDENLFKIDELIDNLADKIVHSSLADTYKEAKQEFNQDKNLQAELKQLNENIDYLPFRPELRELQKNLNLNPKIYQLRLAENDLQELLSEIAKQLADAISPDIDVDENLPLRRGKIYKHGRH